MTEREPDPLFDALRGRLHNHTRQPPPAVWAALETQLRARRQRRRRTAGWAAGALLLLGGAFGGRVWWSGHEAKPAAQATVAPVPARQRQAAPGVEAPDVAATAPVQAAREAEAAAVPAVTAVVSDATSPPQAGREAAATQTLPPPPGHGHSSHPTRQAAGLTFGLAADSARPATSADAASGMARTRAVGLAPLAAVRSSRTQRLPTERTAESTPTPTTSATTPSPASPGPEAGFPTAGVSIAADEQTAVRPKEAASEGTVGHAAELGNPVKNPMRQSTAGASASAGVSASASVRGSLDTLARVATTVEAPALPVQPPAEPAYAALDSTLLGGPVPSRVALGLWLAGGLTHRILEDRATPLARSEKAAPAGSALLSARLALRPNLYLNTGLGVTVYQERVRANVVRYVTRLQQVPDSVAGPDGSPIRTYTWQNVAVLDDTVQVRATAALRYFTLPMQFEWHPAWALPPRWRLAVDLGPSLHVLWRGALPAFTGTCDCEAQEGGLRKISMSMSVGVGLDYALTPDLWLTMRPTATAQLTSVTLAEQAGRYPIGATLRAGLVYELPAKPRPRKPSSK